MKALALIKECFTRKNSYLDLGNCGLRDEHFERESQVNMALKQCVHLTTLVLSNRWWDSGKEEWQKSANEGKYNKLNRLPPAVSALTQLTTLICSGNENTPWHISHLTPLTDLRNLHLLNLSFNQIKEIGVINSLKTLQQLDLSNNEIVTIKDLQYLKNLQELDLSYNYISEIEGLDNLRILKQLHLHDNELTEIKGLHHLTALEELGLSDNYLGEIKGLENLTTLKRLHLHDNALSTIKGFDTLANLKHLDLSKNKIADIEGLDNLTSLEQLDLSYNEIKIIQGIDSLTNLKKLDLMGNLIEDLFPLLKIINSASYALKAITSLSIHQDGQISIYGNPLIRPSMEIVAQGNQAINNYFRNLQAQGIDYLYEAKMLIVGQPRAGKTSLRQKLFDCSSPLPGEERTTRGIDIQQHEFPITDKNGQSRKFLYHVWDFGGQHIYHTTHQFFLTHRSLYALVMDTGKDSIGNDDTTINYWLQIVELLGGSSPLLLILNEKNERKINLDLPQKKARFDFLKGDYTVDFNALISGTATYNGKRKEQFDHLKTDIETALSRLPLVGLPLPANWVKIRKELQELSGSLPYITLEKYREICSRHKVPEYNQQLELSRIFHDLGVFLHFQDYGMLDNFIVLQNTWATDAVFAVLDSETVQTGMGRFTDNDLVKIWEPKGYPPEVHKKLLGLMIRFELCYQIDSLKNGATYIVPEMLPDRAPAGYSWPVGKDQPLQYRYDFMPKGLLTRFIVRLNRNIYIENQQQWVWKTGVRIDGHSMDCPNTYAEITEAWNNQQLNIRIQGSYARELMSKITLVIDELNKEYFRQIDQDTPSPRSKWYKMIPCNCKSCEGKTSKHYYDYSKLLKRKEFGKPTIECELEPYAEVHIDNLIEGVFAKESESITQPEKPKPARIFISYSKDDLPLVNKFIEHLSALQLDDVVAHWYCTELIAGTSWHKEIQEHFDQSDIVCFMVSPNFMRTQYIHEHEIKKAFERKAKDPNFKIIPIILDFCKWTTKINNLGQFTALPYTAKPVVDFKNQNQAWYIIEECLRLMIEKNLYPAGDGFYATQALPKDVLRLFEKIVAGKADA